MHFCSNFDVAVGNALKYKHKFFIDYGVTLADIRMD